MLNQSDLPELAAIFKTAIAAHLAPLQAELAVLKARLDDRPVVKDGAPGRDGKDAPAIDVEALFARLKAELPAPLKGDPGDPGKDGRDGADGAPGPAGPAGKDGVDGISGKDGRDGIDGKDGAPGTAGKDGSNGIDGKDGAPGRDGREGRDGDPGFAGKDAAELTILKGMDESASYQIGTFVSHRGGVFRAYRTTDPVKDKNFEAAGWDCILAGVADQRNELASDQRTLLQTVELSDGKAIVSRMKMPTPLHRGVFRDGITYERGDFVQWGGNLWHANETTTDKPAEGVKAWALAARRGRDGKDPTGGNRE